ncbi:MAG: PD-(D/E)XK nuclease family protein [Bacteroidota bacterium]
MPIIQFGMGFTERCIPLPDSASLNQHSFDKIGLLHYLEGFYGFVAQTERQDFLRVERYRQLLRNDLAQHPSVFYAASFQADPLATAEHVLSLRDELIEAAYPLHKIPPDKCPSRIKTLHRLEQNLLLSQEDNPWPLGVADRLQRQLNSMGGGMHPVLWVKLHEPFNLLDPGSQRLLKKLADCGDFVQYLRGPKLPKKDTDLGVWQAVALSGQEQTEGHFPAASHAEPPSDFIDRWVAEGQKMPRDFGSGENRYIDVSSYRNAQLKADGSLLILKAARETHISAYLSKLLKLNPAWSPSVLMAKKRQTLDLALRMEGLPSMGVPSTSMARPSLQVLKLVPTFLWEPVDLRKLHEFLKLIVKPLDRTLGYRLSTALSDSPGIFSEAWFFALDQYLMEELPRRIARDNRVDPEAIQEQYNFWFRRTRYPIDGRAPKTEVRKLFTYLVNWVKDRTDEDKDDAIGLKTLAAQAKRAVELIDQIDEDQLSPLQVDRIVRTVYEAAPANFQSEQLGSLPAAFHPAAVCADVPELIWWDFVQEEADYFFSNWYQNEIEFLAAYEVYPLSPAAKNQRQMWSRSRPLLFTRDRLVLCCPDYVVGSEVSTHPLLGELEAMFGDDLQSIIVDLDKDAEQNILDWPSPGFSSLELVPMERTRAFVSIDQPGRMHRRQYESPSSIERYIYHPHQWVFQYGLLIKPSRQPALSLGTRLRGLLAHRFMERIFAEQKSLGEWAQSDISRWVTQNEPDILRREGGLLLEYGFEPDRVQFRRQIQRAAWALICSLREDGWREIQSEIELEGQISGLELKARADLLAKKQDGTLAVVDLKWRGKTRFSNLIRNREEIQLNLYAQLLEQSHKATVLTAYYLLSNARMLARTSHAFSSAETIDPEADPLDVRTEILGKLAKTHEWRDAQLASGQLEIRCKQTMADLEEAYQDIDLDAMLEMKAEDAPFDDYRALIGLVD